MTAAIGIANQGQRVNYSIVGKSQDSVQNPESTSKIAKIWMFFYECIIKEFASCLRHGWNQLVFFFCPHKYNVNPVQIKTAEKTDQVAKVVLMLHGAGGKPSCFLPLAKDLANAGIENVYTVGLNQTDADPVPVDSLEKRIKELTDKYLKAGYKKVEFSLVGHSLGALVSQKYVWRIENQPDHNIENAKVSLMISVAGRLKYIYNKFYWFTADAKPEIEQSYVEMCKDPEKVRLYTIWGSKDAIVPEASAHPFENKDRSYTVNGWGHGGILFAEETKNKIVEWVKDWVNTKI